MHWIDIILILWLALSAFSGFRLGFVYKAGSLIGFIASVYFASRWTPGIVEYFDLGWTTTVLVFLIVLSLLTKLFGLVAWLLDKAFHVVYIIPFTKTTNRILGAVLSVIVTCLILTAFVYAVNLAPGIGSLSRIVSESLVLEPVVWVSRAVAPFVSDAFNTLVNARFLQ